MKRRKRGRLAKSRGLKTIGSKNKRQLVNIQTQAMLQLGRLELLDGGFEGWYLKNFHLAYLWQNSVTKNLLKNKFFCFINCR